MQYTVACNWDPQLIDRIDYPEVKSVFAGLPDTVISGGRSSIMINNMNESDIREYIRRVHEKGWSFDYNINSACLSNRELTAADRREMMHYLEWVSGLGVDSVTISVPLLVEMVKKHFPNLRVKVSTFQKINTVSMAQRFEEMGADAIMLSEHVNRDFKLLRAIRESVKCKLVLIANVGCIYGCPNMHTHANSIAHAGAKGQRYSIFTETYQTYCVLRRLESTSELVKIRWIRPEDVSCYEDIGIDMLKIIERNSSTEALAERMKAYHERSYEGNLLDLPGQMTNRKKSNGVNLEKIFDALEGEKIEKVRKFLSVFSISIQDLYYLDNKKIPRDFLKGFETRDCASLSCEQCGYCREIADRAVTAAGGGKINAAVEKLKDLRRQIVDGSILY